MIDRIGTINDRFKGYRYRRASNTPRRLIEASPIIGRMLHTLAVTGPIYLLIALGFAAVRVGVFQRADMRVLGTFVSRFALPALVFSALASRSIGDIVEAHYLVAYAAGSLTAMGLGFAWAWRVRRRGVAFGAFIALGVSTANSGYVGYPIVSQVVGSTAAAASLAMCMIVENLLMIPLALLLADGAHSAAANWRRALLESLRQQVHNPVVLAIVAGFGMSLLRWHLPDVLGRTVSLIALSSSAISLFVIGGSLVGLRLEGMRRDVLAVASTKLMLHPLLVGIGVWLLLPVVDPRLRTAAVVFAAGPMIGIFPILGQRYGLEHFCAAALLLATSMSFVTISVILAIVKSASP